MDASPEPYAVTVSVRTPSTREKIKTRVVIVEAFSADDARHRAGVLGLHDVTLVPATEQDLERWEDQLDHYAAHVPSINEDGEHETRIVVVEAHGPEEAQARTALIGCEFRVATEAELDEWDERMEQPMTDMDIEQLVTFIVRKQREQMRRIYRDAEKGKTLPAHVELVTRFKARKLQELRGKLEALGGDESDEANVSLREVL